MNINITDKEFNGFTAAGLERLGLTRMTPLVKLGLDAMNSSARILEEDVLLEIDKFGSEVLDTASKLPPLGSFQKHSDEPTPLSPTRLGELLKGFNAIIGKSGGPNGSGSFDGLRKVFGAVNLLHSTFSDYKQFSKRANNSIYSNLRM